ncbi:vitamin K epoxide reductase family protein [Chryseobacterium sp. BIGb0232]|uniref:vitamin K epoxide reductase family protein n=1 Tax=Chryseobacterium sp. BIGb0232 TaxID=2940598 RepID=UPI000F477217|nr:vitamin K epoxide reductase family protein [Chryseobacterium sp. BIGb0232]MCS4305362.1 putative membrane protein/thiol-disulfide isomerase/thioredoxin [Chryseobacterium sp. BIGb0232]ROS07573.1 thioredoxin-like protein [Chryseobacterium nakagawai]
MIFDKLINYLKLDKQEFIFQFNSHPNYPSALAFSDTLNFLGVKNDAYQLDKEYWDELPEEFIAIVDNAFSLVKKSGSSYSVYSEKAKTLDKEELYKTSTDFVLLFEKTEQAENKTAFNFKPVLYAVFAVILIYSFIYQNLFEAVFNLLSLAGVYISMEIFNQKFGNTSTVIGSICGAAPATQTANSCDRIIKQDKTSILGLKFSDFSLIYFTGLAILGLFLPATAYILKGFTFVSILAIGYSLYIQAFVEKTFCRVCLLIISILVGQLVISAFFFQNLSFGIGALLLTVILWAIIFSAVIYFNTLLEQKEELQKSNAKNLRFKRNYELFKSQLLERDKVEFQDTETFSVGKKDARLRISIISNPYCGFCKDGHKLAESLLKKYPEDVSLQMRFNYTAERSNEKYNALISDFTSIYNNKPEKEFLHAVEEWFETRDENKINILAGGTPTSENLDPLIQMTVENSNAGLNFTPILVINGYQFPEKYDREDILFFVDELIEDEEI